MPRTFIAFDIDAGNQRRLAGLKDQLHWGRASVKWVQADNLHLTLKFLGDISDEQVSAIQGFLPDFLKNANPVETWIDQLGAFPDNRHPKVLWAGLTGAIDQLKSLAKRLDEGLEALGFPRENKEFASHITIGRVKSAGKSDKLDETLRGFRFTPPLPQTLKTLTFYQSTLTPHGSVYTPLAKIDLMAGSA